MIKTEAATWGSLFSCRGNYQITGDPQSLIETLQDFFSDFSYSTIDFVVSTVSKTFKE